MARRIRLFFGLTGVMAVLAGFALPSDAGLLGTGSASYCDPDSAQTFRPWSDSSYYMLTPGGSFESGSPSWDLNGGAKVVSYVRQQPSATFSGDLTEFVDDAAVRGHLQRAWYLTSVQFGFEPWVGGDGLTVERYSTWFE